MMILRTESPMQCGGCRKPTSAFRDGTCLECYQYRVEAVGWIIMNIVENHKLRVDFGRDDLAKMDLGAIRHLLHDIREQAGVPLVPITIGDSGPMPFIFEWSPPTPESTPDPTPYDGRN